ncbi:MAG: hypothetical protein IJS71_06715 [Clostridia bacterium]|nr:hypothetical protein [Clostridia bacterium]
MEELISEEKKARNSGERVAAGIAGAFLFSLAGGVAFFVLYQVGIIASMSGFLGVILAIKGYKLFAKKESVKGIVISSVIAFLVLLAAWYICISKDVYDAYQLWHQEGEIDFTLTFFQSMAAVPEFMKIGEVASGWLRDLALGLLFALMGSGYTVFTMIKRVKTTGTTSVPVIPVGDDDTGVHEDTAPIRSAYTDEKVKELLKTNAQGHEIVFRRVGKRSEELVIDGSVYAEHELEKVVQLPYSMHAYLDGHRYDAGCGRGVGNFIGVDRQVVAKKFRW